ncbi:MAG: hypothetical protein ACFB51_01900 [Anaerolineae bacterium]
MIRVFWADEALGILVWQFLPEWKREDLVAASLTHQQMYPQLHRPFCVIVDVRQANRFPPGALSVFPTLGAAVRDAPRRAEALISVGASGLVRVTGEIFARTYGARLYFYAEYAEGYTRAVQILTPSL